MPRNNGVEADRGFSRMPRGNDNRYNILYFDAQIGDFLKLRDNRGFWEFIETGVLWVAGWLVGRLFFCVDGIEGAQQCNVLQATSGDIDGIIHTHSCCAGFECWFFSHTINQTLC